ncbi:MAG: hypothetical protein IKI29_06295 [Clostridia bacterium]|nr:hypothetical protein [Clostridia bacterium]
MLILAVTLLVLIVLIGLVFALFYKDKSNEPSYDAEITQYNSTNYRLRLKKRELEQQINERTQQYDTLTLGDTSVLLCVRRVKQELYTDIYPFLKDYKVMFTVSEGYMPGDPGCITLAQYREMVSNGWQPLLAGPCPSTVQELSKWKSYLPKQLKFFQSNGLQKPSAFFFFTGCDDEFRPDVMQVLHENGFDYCNWPIADYYRFPEETEENVHIIPSYSIIESTDSNVSSVLLNLLKGDSIIISCSSITDSVSDETREVSTEKYSVMLNFLADNDLSDKIMTVDMLRDYRKKIRAEENATNLSSQIEELQEQLDQIDQEISDSVNAIK